jgi:hypothetical protein
MPPTSALDQLSTLVDIAVKIAAAIVGGWWFFRRSIHRVRLNLEQDVRVFRIPEEVGGKDIVILKVLVKMENIGEVPFSLDKLSVGAVQFLPLPELAESRFSDTCTVVVDETLTEGDGSQGWTGLASGEGKIRVELRPGEFEVVPATVQMRAWASDAQFAMVVSQVTEHQRWYPKRSLCWKVQSLVPLKNEEVAAVSDEKVSVRSGNPIVIKVPTGAPSGGASGGSKK